MAQVGSWLGSPYAIGGLRVVRVVGNERHNVPATRCEGCGQVKPVGDCDGHWCFVCLSRRQAESDSDPRRWVGV